MCARVCCLYLRSLYKISIYLSYCLILKYSVMFIYSMMVIRAVENPAGMGTRKTEENISIYERLFYCTNIQQCGVFTGHLVVQPVHDCSSFCVDLLTCYL